MKKRQLCTLLFLLHLFCLQGPWEYRADTTPVFRGLTINAYIIAGRPITDFCVERLRTLEETYTAAFPFYDSATVTVKGDGGNGLQTITLTPKTDCPNCFTGPLEFTGQPGKSYELNARFIWDSSGTRVTSTITGSAAIPLTWKMDPIAKVNAEAITPGGTSITEENPALTALFGNLPPDIINAVATLYLPEIDSIRSDTTALINYFSENGQRIQKTIDSLMKDEKRLVPYTYGDTLTYMTGSYNLLAHYFSIDYSDDIAGMLITHKFDDDALNPINNFFLLAAAFGPLGPSNFYQPGSEYRLQFYPLIDDGSVQLFKNIPVSNSYLRGGKNTFYFYGTNSNYTNFVRTYIEQHSASNVTPIHSVEGAQGYFAGMSLDSFIVYITIPPDLQAYTPLESKAAFCSDEEWQGKDCRCFEPEYCEKVNFNEMQYAFENPSIIREPQERNSCLAEAVAHYLKEGKGIDYVADSVLLNGNTIEYDIRDERGTVSRQSKTFTESELADAKSEGLLRYCIRDEFGDPVCGNVEDSCKTGTGYAAEALFTWCEDNNWQPSPCRWASALYCRNKANPPKELCTKGNNWCTDNPDDNLCR